MSKAAELAALIGSQTAQGNKNLAINGAMNVAQRGDVTGLTAVSYGGPDRYRLALNDLGTYSITQSSTSPDGFSNSFKVDCTTADTSVAAGAYVILQQKIEAQNLQRLLYGSSSAKRTVISFWVRSNLTGTYPFNIYVGDSARHITETYTIDSADTWEQKKIAIDAETVGAINDDNGLGVDLSWFLASGSTYTGGSATGWNAYSSTSTSYARGITVNMSSSTSNEWYLTGVQWEIGDVATPFEHEDIGTTLRKCQRYYNMMGADAAYSFYGACFCSSTTVGKVQIMFPVEMRTAPTLGSSTVSKLGIFTAAGNPVLTSININNPSTWGTAVDPNVSSGLTAGQSSQLIAVNDASAYLEFIAEL